MAKTIKPTALGDAIAQELALYAEEVAEKVNAAGDKSMKKLVKLTKAKAPKMTGEYRKHITSTAIDEGHGMKSFVWHVKAPDHRLTHLLVHGHAKVNGGRVKGDPFLHNAVDEVLPEYEKDVEEALKG